MSRTLAKKLAHVKPGTLFVGVDLGLNRIADLLRAGKYTAMQLLHGRYAELRHYAALYEQLQRKVGQQKNLLHAGVGQLFPELAGVFKDLAGGTALAMLQNHAAVSVIREMSPDAFIAGVRADFRGQRLQVSKLRDALLWLLPRWACGTVFRPCN